MKTLPYAREKFCGQLNSRLQWRLTGDSPSDDRAVRLEKAFVHRRHLASGGERDNASRSRLDGRSGNRTARWPAVTKGPGVRSVDRGDVAGDR